jgi:hypothetical protein
MTSKKGKDFMHISYKTVLFLESRRQNVNKRLNCRMKAEAHQMISKKGNIHGCKLLLHIASVVESTGCRQPLCRRQILRKIVFT